MESLVTVEDFAGYLQRDIDRYSAELALTGVSGLIRDYCGWALTRVPDDMLIVDSQGGQVLTLPTLRLNAVASVVVDGTTMDTSAYTWGANGVLYCADGWPCGARVVTTVVDHGYDPIPDAVRIVVCAIAARVYSNPEALSSKSSGDGSRTFMPLLGGARPWSDLETVLLSPYRIV